MKKGVFEFIGLIVIVFLVIFLVANISITGYQVANTPDEIVNSAGTDSEFEDTEVDLDGFNFISIEDYTSENLSQFPWVTFIIGLIFIVLIALAVTFLTVYYRNQKSSVVLVRKPTYNQQVKSAQNNVSNTTNGLPLRATQKTQLNAPVRPVQAQNAPQNKSVQQTQNVSQSAQNTQQTRPAASQQQIAKPASTQPQPTPQPATSNLSETLRYIKYYSHNMSRNPKVRIDYLLGQGKEFLRKNDKESAKKIYSFINEEYKFLTNHDEQVYLAIVQYAQSLK